MKCPLCKDSHTEIIYRQKYAHFTDGKTSMPLEVSLCSKCGFVFQNSAYNDKYDKKVVLTYQNYRMSDNFAFPRQDKKSLDSLQFIIKNGKIDKNSNILEIGSDRGDFLYLLHEKTGANVMGIEPVTLQIPKFPTVRGYFTRNSFCSKFDLIILKHTLEHIKNPKEFMVEVWESLSENGLVYTEVPSLDVVMSHFLEDFSLEHVSYFSQDSLLRLLKGYEVVSIDNSHFLRILAKRKASKKILYKKPDIAKTRIFFAEFSRRLRALEQKIILHSQRNIVIFYGVGLYFQALLARLMKKSAGGGGGLMFRELLLYRLRHCGSN